MPARPRAPSGSALLGCLALAGVYVATGLLFRTPALRPISDGLTWPPVGLALAGLLLFGSRLWPGVVAGAFLEPWLAGIPPATSLGSSLGIVLETVGAAWLLGRTDFRPSLERVRDVLRLLCVAVLGGALLGAAVNTASKLLTGSVPWSELVGYWLGCYRGDALAFLMVTPLPLTWGAGGVDWLRRKRGEAVAFVTGLAVVTYFSTGGLPVRLESGFPTRYLTFPFLFWGALRLGPSAVAAANAIVVGIAASGMWLAEGALPGEPVGDRMLLLWAYSFFGSFTGLLLAANAREREVARQQAQMINEANAHLTRSLNLDIVLDTLLTAMARLVPFDTANVMLNEGGQLLQRAERNYERFGGRPHLGPFPIEKPFWWERLQQGSVLIADTELEPGWAELPGCEHVRNWLAVPLRAGGELIGLYSLDKAEPGFFTSDHVRLAEALATQGAVAIANARLYEQSRRDQEALRASEERFLKAFRLSPVAMSISTLAEGRYLEVNEAYLRLTGHERAEVVGRSSLDLGVWAHPEQRPVLLEQLGRRGRVLNFEWELRTKSGELRLGLLSAETVDLGGEPHLLAGVLDMTETRRLEEQVRQAHKMEAVGRLAGGVAHDFNNMMMVITAHCELLARERTPGDSLPPAVEEIRQVARSAASLSRQLLAFSRKQTLQPRVLRLNLLCERSLRMLRRLIGDHIEIRFLPDPGLRNVRADPSGLEQVLMNLCVNARDAMPQGGTLTIATGNSDLVDPLPAGEDALPPGRYVHLRVADTGVGIDTRVKGQIFEPFFTTKETGKGTGLGLAVVYGVVRQSGGAISVDSAPGQGSVFTVHLPETDEPLETTEPARPAPARGSETLLLVDDNEAVRRVIAKYLRAEGYTVVTADDGPEALDVARGCPLAIDMLLTDVMMPGLTGVQLAEALRALYPDLLVLYLSGHPAESLSSDGVLPARTRFLQKPLPLNELVQEIRSLLDERQDAAGLR